MGRIKLLSENVFVKIAAGEVVDRPAAVVRELIDNSIDAGAKQITVEVNNGGLDLIVVTDDGDGIERDDLKLALLQHATSKITTVEDIYRVQTNGFRGEALHAIQSVSRFCLKSCTGSDPSGAGFMIANYNEPDRDAFEISPAALNRGTVISVSDLFYNLPARRKFMKSSLTEFNVIKKTLIEKIFSYPDTIFKLIKDGKVVLRTGKCESFTELFNSVFENESNIKLHEREFKTDEFSIKLYYSSQDRFYGTRKYQSLYVNNRPVVLPFFYGAVDSGIRDYISPGRHPVVFCFVTMDPSLVDVNVHPAKKEIRVYESDRLFNAIVRTVKSAYSAIVASSVRYEPISFHRDAPSTDGQSAEGHSPEDRDTVAPTFSERPLFDDFSQGKMSDYRPAASFPTDVDRNKNYDDFMDFLKTNSPKQSGIDSGIDYKVMGVFSDTYILISHTDRLVFIDQHALSEAIIFNSKREIFYNKNEQEQLLIPLMLHLSRWNTRIEKNIELLIKNGFNLEMQEGNTIRLTGVPSFFLMKRDYSELGDIIEDFLFENTSDKNILDELLIQSSCREAVKKGDRLPIMVIEEMVDEMFRLNITNCPHGRPVFYEITSDYLDKFFQRKK